MASYVPQSGVNGSVVIGVNTLAADTWTYQSESHIMEAPSFTGAPYMEHCAGMRKSVFTFSGTWNVAFNPFANGIKIGRQVQAQLWLNNTQVAYDDDAFVQSFDVTDAADGKAEYVCTLVVDWRWLDFSGVLA